MASLSSIQRRKAGLEKSTLKKTMR